MSASNEWFEYHLTPNGWVDGSEKLDCGYKDKPTPPDTVLTVRFCEFLSSMYSPMVFTAEINPLKQESILELLNTHGTNPHPNAMKFDEWSAFVARNS